MASLGFAMAEEYHIFVQAKTLQFMTKELKEDYGIDLENLKDIFSNIIKDEEEHMELLATIKRAIVGKEQRKKDNAPIVKYQDPDSWVRALPPRQARVLFCYVGNDF